jgi:hypothetical protein
MPLHDRQHSMVDSSLSVLRVLQKHQEVGSSKEKITYPQNQVAIAGKGSFSQEKVTSFCHVFT